MPSGQPHFKASVKKVQTQPSFTAADPSVFAVPQVPQSPPAPLPPSPGRRGGLQQGLPGRPGHGPPSARQWQTQAKATA